MNQERRKSFTIAQVRVGDVLTGGSEKQGGRFYDWRYKVLEKGGAHRLFKVVRLYPDGSTGTVERETGAQLTAGGWSTVWRDGVKVGTFCVKYW